MCTCLELKNKDCYFGRTLDLDFHFNEEAVIVPRNYEFKCPNALNFKNRYALIGTAFINGDYPLFYEACNEKGLAMAGLNFPVNTKYNKPKEDKLNLTVFEIIPYILGNYESIKELRKDLERLNITDTWFNKDMPISPLHFMLSDKDDCIVLEQVEDGLHIYENKIGVMTNNPPFNLQLENLNKYKDLTNKYVEPEDSRYRCVGLGSLGLPGDYSSMSRFSKVAFLKEHVVLSNDENQNVSEFFHILDSVSMIKGTVVNKNDRNDITFYSSCINTSKGIYYYKTYYNNQISSLRLREDNMNSKGLTRFKLIDSQNINRLN